MYPELELFGLELQTFGLMFGLGFVVAGVVIALRLRELRRPWDWSYELVYCALFGGMAGAKLWFLAGHWSEVRNDLFVNIFTGSGFVWYGGLVGGALAVGFWAQSRGMVRLELLDLVAPSLAIGQAIGRVGCQLSGDGDYGVQSNLPWAMSYPDGTVPTTERVHPTPVYEALWLGLIAYLLWRLRNRFAPGVLFATYLLLVGIERFVVEFIRRNPSILAGLTSAQVFSLCLFSTGVVILLTLRSRSALGRQPLG